MKAGSELDGLIAEKVMGWKEDKYRGVMGWLDGHIFHSSFKPSTNIEDAWKVLEKLIQLGAEINVGFYEQWDCSIDYPIGCNWLVQTETAPLAICLAALEAVGYNMEVANGKH